MTWVAIIGLVSKLLLLHLLSYILFQHIYIHPIAVNWSFLMRRWFCWVGCAAWHGQKTLPIGSLGSVHVGIRHDSNHLSKRGVVALPHIARRASWRGYGLLLSGCMLDYSLWFKLLDLVVDTHDQGIDLPLKGYYFVLRDLVVGGVICWRSLIENHSD